MNYRMIIRLLGTILRIVAVLMLPALLISVFQGESRAVYGFAITLGVIAVLSVLCLFAKPKRNTMYAREGYAVVGVAWILLSILGALPFYFSGAIPSFIDCLFETASGFTTTGASILTDVEAMPMGLLFWRSFTHWLGGMGVLVFMLAITPMAAGSGESLHIMRAESPGPQVSKLVPRTLKTAQILYTIYIGMTVLQIILMLLGGMPVFDSVITAFGTAGTGGFGIKADSMAGYSPYLQWVVAIFMALFGVNFAVYYLLLIKEVKKALFNEELRFYLGLMLLSATVIFLNIMPMFPGNAGDAIRHAFFQISSIMTTTGFATTDFNAWPEASRAILVMLMLVGASAGSTGGGIKCARILILLKSLRLQIRKMLHPNVVHLVRMDGETVEPETVNNALAFLVAYCAIAIGSILIVSFDGFSFETNLTSVFACLNNIGPGLGLVGPMGSYAGLSNLSKLVLTLDMLIGRLEIFPILILCVPSVWKRARA